MQELKWELAPLPCAEAKGRRQRWVVLSEALAPMSLFGHVSSLGGRRKVKWDVSGQSSGSEVAKAPGVLPVLHAGIAHAVLQTA